MNSPQVSWSAQYGKNVTRHVYPTEWVVRTLAGGTYPEMKLDKNRYKGRKIFDLSCGDGRNLQLLKNLGFSVYGSEIGDEIVEGLKLWFPEVSFAVCKNNKIPFHDGFFDYILSCGACYYLEEGTHFEDNLREIRRVIAKDGYFIGNIPDSKNTVIRDAVINDRREALITNDPFGIRNGVTLQICDTKDELIKLLSPFFKDISVGHFDEDFYGLRVSGLLFVCKS